MVIDFGPACEQLIEIVAGIDDGRLGAPTPCTDYAVKDLLAHVDQVAVGFAAVARKSDGGEEPPVGFGNGWRDQLSTRLRELATAWRAPDAWKGTGKAAGIELPSETWGKIAFTEVVVHGWDLARATARPFALPEETLRACWEHVSVFVPQAPIPGLWGPAVPVPGDAPLLDRILGVTGRRP